ncbi:MAG: purine-nucleoside phosphorylase [Candidatus Cloacimonadota bacterium]|nr:MAG: purine-nucleoside phosphorylase [Candidatus Cloacimonadota bacterium]
MNILEKIEKTKNFIESKIDFQPQLGIILGTGLNSIAEIVENQVKISYKEIPGFAESTAPSHQGRLILGKINGKNIVVMQGRFHFYEGYSMSEVTFPIRVFKALGVSTLIVTNAAGSLNENLQPGDIVLIKDHINLMGTNPLIGKNYKELGERFPSMNEPYSAALRELSRQIAFQNAFSLQEGVYAAVTGPSLETKSECLMMQKLGADLVGMSTVPEVIVAIHSKIEVLGISVVTNLSNIFHSQAHSQEEIRENADKAREKMEILILNIIKMI